MRTDFNYSSIAASKVSRVSKIEKMEALLKRLIINYTKISYKMR